MFLFAIPNSTGIKNGVVSRDSPSTNVSEMQLCVAPESKKAVNYLFLILLSYQMFMVVVGSYSMKVFLVDETSLINCLFMDSSHLSGDARHYLSAWLFDLCKFYCFFIYASYIILGSYVIFIYSLATLCF